MGPHQSNLSKTLALRASLERVYSLAETASGHRCTSKLCADIPLNFFLKGSVEAEMRAQGQQLAPKDSNGSHQKVAAPCLLRKPDGGKQSYCCIASSPTAAS